MRNVIQIVIDNFKRAFSNGVSVVILLGMVVVPCLYAWFNICGSWDPFGNTSQLKIAVINEDAGYEDNYIPYKVTIGSDIQSSLITNSSFSWVYKDFDSAMEDLNDGDIYAAIYIPSDFSQDIMSVLTKDKKEANLIYYENEKKSAIAPKITSKGADAIQQKISKNFTESFMNSVFKIAKNLIELKQSDTATSLISRLSSGFGDAALTIEGANIQIDSLKNVLTSLDPMLDELNSLIPENKNERLAEITAFISESNSLIQQGRDSLDQAAAILEKAGIAPFASKTMKEISQVLENIQNINNANESIANNTYESLDKLKTSISSYKDLISSLNARMTELENLLDVTHTDLINAKSQIDLLNNDSTVEDIKKIIGDNPTSLAEIISEPVKIDRHAVWPVKNTGSSMAAFYTGLSIWVGCLIMTTIILMKFSKKRVNNINVKNMLRAIDKKKKYKKLKSMQAFFGQYIFFAILAVMQAIVVTLGEIFFIGIQVVHPFLYVGTACFCAVIFSFFIFTLATALGNVGKALGVILLVLQVAASGGMFPAEMIAEPFNTIYYFLPLSYVIEAFHCCIAGFNGYILGAYYIALFLLLVPISLIIAFTLGRTITKRANWFERKVHSSHVAN